MITAAQIREARELIGWSRYMLAGAAGVPHSILLNAERRLHDPLSTTDQALVLSALEGAGIIFVEENGEGRACGLGKNVTSPEDLARSRLLARYDRIRTDAAKRLDRLRQQQAQSGQDKLKASKSGLRVSSQ